MASIMQSPSGVRLGSGEVHALDICSRSTQRCRAPHTVLEKRLGSVCSRLAEFRPTHEVSWLASHLKKMPALQHTPVWKLRRLSRNMAVAFAREGDDVALLCADPAFSYFVVNGSLTPVAIAEHVAPLLFTPSPLACSGSGSGSGSGLHRARPREERNPAAEAKARQHPTPVDAPVGGVVGSNGLPRRVAGGVERSLDLSFCPRTFPDDNTSSVGDSVWTPAARRSHSHLMESGSEYGSTVNSKKCVHSAHMMTPTVCSSPVVSDTKCASNKTAAVETVRREERPLLLGQFLDPFLFHTPLNGVEEMVGSVEGRDEGECPADVSAAPERLLKHATAPQQWRLLARDGVCVGRVSGRFLDELGPEEAKHSIEVKVAFLQKTEVFGDGFSAACLQRLALVMERQEQPAATVVRSKGSVADKVIMVESGEAVRLGDIRANSMKNYSSLRVRAGQMFGAEEALAGVSGYTGNLMSMSPLRFFAIPTAAFLEALNGVWTEPLYRLRSRARVVSRTCRVLSGGQHRPSFASKRSLRRNWSSGGNQEKSLPTLTPSETRHPPVTLTPMPLFSGTKVDRGLEERMNIMAAVWTPWVWSADDHGSPVRRQKKSHEQRQKQEQGDQHAQDPDERKQVHLSSSKLRPHSAPAPTTTTLYTSALLQQVTCQPRRSDTSSDDSSRLPRDKAARSCSAGDLPRWSNHGSAVVQEGASSFSTARRGEGGFNSKGREDRPSAASPDFRSLEPCFHRTNPLFGCDFNLLTADSVDDQKPITVAGEEDIGGEDECRSERAVVRRRSIPRSKATRQNNERKEKKRPATCRVFATPHNEHSSRAVSTRTHDLSALDVSFSLGVRPSLCGSMSGDEGGVCADTGDIDAVDVGGGGSGSAKNSVASPSPATQSLPSSSSSTGSWLISRTATTPEPRDKGEFTTAKRAVSCRPERIRLCLGFRVQASTSAGMAAAQRSHRGAFVMSKMGNAKARSSWRP